MDDTQGDAEPSQVFGAVMLDTSVLYPLPPRDTLLRLAERDLFRPRWSAQILEELRRNLVADKRGNESGARRLLAAMRRHYLNAEILPRYEVIECMTNAVEDRHVLAVAVESGAEIIVTSNLKDFPASALAPLGIEARSPDDFLGQLYDAAPTTVARVLREQAAALVAPPMTIADVPAASASVRSQGGGRGRPMIGADVAPCGETGSRSQAPSRNSRTTSGWT